MHFTCPEEHFYEIFMLTLWNNFQLWARKCRICGGNFAALLVKLLFCLQMGNWKNSFEGNFTFSDFFRTSREHFLVSLVYHSRHGGPNWIPQARKNISIRKTFVRKLFILSGLWVQLFEHSLKSFRHVVKTTVFLFTGALWERLIFFEFLKIVFGLWAILVQTSGEYFSSVAQTAFYVSKELLDFFANFCHVSFNFVFERKKS